MFLKTKKMKKSNVLHFMFLLFGAIFCLPSVGITQDISGTYRIQVKANNRFFHEDATGDKLISTRHQRVDDNTRFILEIQADGSYRVKGKGSNRYWHVDTSSDRILSTRWQPTDDHTRFFFENQGNGFYRIKLKATNRYLHEDGGGDKVVSTRWQPTDDFTKFKLIQEPTRPIVVNKPKPVNTAFTEPILGQIIMFAGNFAPRGWAFCSGQLLPIQGNEALFSILGTVYGGDGRTTFGLPDLRGRAPIHAGQGPGLPNVRLGEKTDGNSVENSTSSSQRTVATTAVNYIIATQGSFPSRQ